MCACSSSSLIHALSWFWSNGTILTCEILLLLLLLGIKTVRIATIELESSPAFSQPADWDKPVKKPSADDGPSLYTLYVGCQQQRQDNDGDGSAVFTIGWYNINPFDPFCFGGILLALGCVVHDEALLSNGYKSGPPCWVWYLHASTIHRLYP